MNLERQNNTIFIFKSKSVWCSMIQNKNVTIISYIYNNFLFLVEETTVWTIV